MSTTSQLFLSRVVAGRSLGRSPPANSKGLGISWRGRLAGRAPGEIESWTSSLRYEPTQTRIGAYIVWFRSTAFAGSV